ncbi:hypothetical protein FFLO_01309 [Filobasidium floriforme]|uniref:Agmatinase n=1 Tax=Filobasidium floriforme TaxID=5210 RepID=A0A8K0JUW0_9TREE|nr:hypothetical protein FFLO_01309 [Filobasidium floriforme]
MPRLSSLLALAAVPLVLAHSNHQTADLTAEEIANKDAWFSKYGKTGDLSFTGVTSFAHLPHVRCLDEPGQELDVAIIGMPFDSAVSFRPGARFGPFGIRSGSRRQTKIRGYSSVTGINPYQSGYSVIDCGDVPISPFDPSIAIPQVADAYASLLSRKVPNATAFEGLGFAKGLDGELHPRVISLGGDHTIVLPILESLHSVYGPISVIHFDAHIDTWNPKRYMGSLSPQADINHGTFFWHAYEKGFIKPGANIHAGIRTRFSGPEDLQDDVTAGFDLIHTYDLDDMGLEGITRKIKSRVGNGPVYISLDIDVADPSAAPATGTPESGGWSSRELRRIVQSMKGLNIVGMDIVEVAPAYDTNAELTSILAADLVYDFLNVLAGGVDGRQIQEKTAVHEEL